MKKLLRSLGGAVRSRTGSRRALVLVLEEDEAGSKPNGGGGEVDLAWLRARARGDFESWGATKSSLGGGSVGYGIDGSVPSVLLLALLGGGRELVSLVTVVRRAKRAWSRQLCGGAEVRSGRGGQVEGG